MLGQKSVKAAEGVLQTLNLGVEDFDKPAATGTDQVIMMGVPIEMLVACRSILESQFARKPALAQQSHGPINGGAAHRRVSAPGQGEQLIGRVVFLGLEERREYIQPLPAVT
jgi:hypothetical protein